MESEGIHRVRVPASPMAAVAIVGLIVTVLRQWPSLRWIALASLIVGWIAAVALILWRRRSRSAPPAARLHFPPE